MVVKLIFASQNALTFRCATLAEATDQSAAIGIFCAAQQHAGARVTDAPCAAIGLDACQTEQTDPGLAQNCVGCGCSRKTAALGGWVADSFSVDPRNSTVLRRDLLRFAGRPDPASEGAHFIRTFDAVPKRIIVGVVEAALKSET